MDGNEAYIYDKLGRIFCLLVWDQFRETCIKMNHWVLIWEVDSLSLTLDIITNLFQFQENCDLFFIGLDIFFCKL